VIRQAKINWHQASAWIDLAKFALVAAVAVWLVVRGAQGLGYNWQWYRIPRYLFFFEDGRLILGPLLEGLFLTLKITALSLVLAFAIGLITALLRLSHSFVGRLLARAYLELIRNTPLLIQIFFIYFVVSPVLDMGAFTSAVLALSLFEGAYGSEIIRAGILSIPKGQWEAAHSLGLGRYHTYRRVVLPQALRQITPPLTSQAISLIKDSALVSTIAIYELTLQGQAIIAQTFLTFEVWFTVAAIYLMLTVSLSLLAEGLRRRLGAPL
jgi:polar amino acid transport system permease protein